MLTLIAFAVVLVTVVAWLAIEFTRPLSAQRWFGEQRRVPKLALSLLLAALAIVTLGGCGFNPDALAGAGANAAEIASASSEYAAAEERFNEGVRDLNEREQSGAIDADRARFEFEQLLAARTAEQTAAVERLGAAGGELAENVRNIPSGDGVPWETLIIGGIEAGAATWLLNKLRNKSRARDLGALNALRNATREQLVTRLSR